MIIDIGDCQGLFVGYGLRCYKALTEIEDVLVKSYTRFPCCSIEVEVILRTTKNRQSCLVVLKSVLSSGCISYSDCFSAAFVNSALLWRDSDVLVSNALPLEVKVKITFISELNLLGPCLVDEEFTKVKLASFVRCNSDLGFISHHRVVNLVTFTLNV